MGKRVAVAGSQETLQGSHLARDLRIELQVSAQLGEGKIGRLERQDPPVGGRRGAPAAACGRRYGADVERRRTRLQVTAECRNRRRLEAAQHENGGSMACDRSKA